MDFTPAGLVGLRDELRRVYDEHYALFHRLFAEGAAPDTAELEPLAGLLCERGLASREDGEVRSAVRFTRLGRDFLCTDHPEYDGRDRVLYLSDNESLLLARALPSCDGRRVLDVGTGSGVQAVAAYRRGAAAVTSIDISPRAVEMARFNLALNGLPADGVRLVPLADFAPEAPYDLLVNNPPFVPVPPGTRFMTSGAGGVDGLDFVRALVARLPELLHERGELHMVTLSPGTRHLSELELMLLDHAAGRPVRLSVSEVFGGPCPIGESLEPFKGYADVDAWLALLTERGYTHMHNLLLSLGPVDVPSFTRSVLSPPLELHPGNKGSTTWDGLHAEIRLALEKAQ